MIGSELGCYRLVRELGSGGMGTVYLAEGADGRVAVKVVHPHLIATPGFFKRFLREAELGRKVTHENVVRTIDVDATVVNGQQVNYMVMEYVEGKSLRALLNDLRTIPESLLREIALQTAAGLAAIHERDIVHRDLKPENVLITDDHRIRIMDLGVAKLQEASIAITKEGQFAGSVLYAAPEQFSSADVGPTTDQYSLGVMLYELATGENPFRRDDAAAVIQAHLSFEPPSAAERNSEITSFLSEVVSTLLAKAPADRFESAGTLRTVLSEGERAKWWEERAPRIRQREAQLPRIRVHRETALHGRDSDLEVLREAWGRACAGHGSTVLAEGEAGIGKTRLVDAFLRGLEGEPLHVLYGSYPPSGGLGGFSDAILGKFGTANLATVLKPYLPDTPALIPTFAALVKHETLPTAAEPMQGDALHAVSVQLMRSLAAERPTIWIVDDLHFAPKESRDLVLSLARAAEGHRVLLLLTARPGLPEEEMAHFSRLGNLRRMTLGRLSPREVLDLLADAFKSDALAERLGGKIALKSDGVPFFVFEMIRGLKEGQFLEQRPDGTYVQTQLITDIEVPSAVKDLIDGRMRGLTESQRAILDVGAVQGMAFDPGLVAAVLEEKKVRVLRDIAEIERRFGLVRGEDQSIRFDQNQIQEVLYSGLLPDLRREYHTLLADAFAERLEGDAAGPDACFLALHHLRGSQPKRGLKHVEPALDHLLGSYRNDAAFEMMDLSLRHLTGKERIELLLRKAERLNLVGRRDEMGEVTAEAERLARELGAQSLMLKALETRAFYYDRISDCARAERAYAEVRNLAVAAGDRDAEAAAHLGLGNVNFNLMRLQDAMAAGERSLEISRELGDPKREGAAANLLGNVLNRLERPDEALEWHQRALQSARERGDRSAEAGSTINSGNCHSIAGRLEDALAHYERGRAIAREVGNRTWEANATGNVGRIHAVQGNYAEALPHLRKYLEMKIEVGERRGEMNGALAFAFASITLGKADEARHLADRGLEISRGLGDHAQSLALECVGKCAEAAGDEAEATRLYREAVAMARAAGEPQRLAEALAALGGVLPRAEAGEHLNEAAALGSADTQIAALALLGDAPATRAALEEQGGRVTFETRMEALFRIGEVEEAHRLLMHLRDHAPEDCRESILENVPLHREIVAAFSAR